MSNFHITSRQLSGKIGDVGVTYRETNLGKGYEPESWAIDWVIINGGTVPVTLADVIAVSSTLGIDTSKITPHNGAGRPWPIHRSGFGCYAVLFFVSSP